MSPDSALLEGHRPALRELGIKPAAVHAKRAETAEAA